MRRFVATIASCLLLTVCCIDGRACTVFVYAGAEDVLFGNNEDFARAVPRIWTLSPTDVYHGCIFFGFDAYAQGGINTAGLCFDATGVPPSPAPSLTGARSLSHRFDFCQAALMECATIDELDVFLQTRFLDRIFGGQFLFADATGASLVLNVSAEGRITTSRTEDVFRVITNFNLAAPQLGGYPCRRYDKATADLEAILAGMRELSVESFAETLGAVHIDAGGSETMYSNVFDLTRGLVTLYARHNFNDPVVLRVADFVSESRNVLITSLFEAQKP